MQGIVGKRGALVAALAAVAGGVLAVGVAAHTTRYDSNLTLNAFTSGGANEDFYGEVSSPNPRCEPDRKVRIFRKRPGDDRLYDSTRSLAPAGTYTVTAPTGNLPQGLYYSNIRRRDLRPGEQHAHLCKGANSPEVDVGP